MIADPFHGLRGRVEAPFTPEQVTSLWHYQFGPWKTYPGTKIAMVFHPFTCPKPSGADHGDVDLVPTVRGWICPFCDYTQNWAHGFMAAYDSLPEPPSEGPE